MYHVGAQSVDERMVNVHYYYYKQTFYFLELSVKDKLCTAVVIFTTYIPCMTNLVGFHSNFRCDMYRMLLLIFDLNT